MSEYFIQGFQSFYEVVWVFLVYAFLGWCTEVSYAALDTGRFVNRGFLNGPVCPIYGCGVVIVVSLLTPLKENLAILFIGSVILTTLLELLVGWGLETLFHHHWWDYSMYPFNFKGYICLKFSILWGLACTFIMDVFHPFIMKIIRIIPHIAGVVILIVLMILFIADCIITVSTVLKFNKRLRLLEDLQQQLDRMSDGIGKQIYKNTTEVIEITDKVKEDFSERKEEFTSGMDEHRQAMEEKSKELMKKYQEVLQERAFFQNRLMKAFPNMKSNTFKISLEKLKDAKGIFPKRNFPRK
ncbi:MAG: hypothetical protein ACI39H_09905 [Lachnospiraceae bacterium]